MKKETEKSDESFKNYFNYSICDEINKLFKKDEKNYIYRKCEFTKMKNRALIIK